MVKWSDFVLTYEPLVQDESYFSFFLITKEPSKIHEGTPSYCKKIGNVFDNPELIPLCTNKTEIKSY